MAYLVILSDKCEASFNQSLLTKHVTYLKQINSTNNLVICGPSVNNKAGILIIRASSIDEATRIIESDPFIINGYYQKFTIQEFIEANNQNNYLA